MVHLIVTTNIEIIPLPADSQPIVQGPEELLENIFLMMKNNTRTDVLLLNLLSPLYSQLRRRDLSSDPTSDCRHNGTSVLKCNFTKYRPIRSGLLTCIFIFFLINLKSFNNFYFPLRFFLQFSFIECQLRPLQIFFSSILFQILLPLGLSSESCKNFKIFSFS